MAILKDNGGSMRNRAQEPVYELGAGRCILVDGKSLCTLQGVRQPDGAGYDPVLLDAMARKIVELLNRDEAAEYIRSIP